jgi:hypothetical protein
MQHPMERHINPVTLLAHKRQYQAVTCHFGGDKWTVVGRTPVIPGRYQSAPVSVSVRRQCYVSAGIRLPAGYPQVYRFSVGAGLISVARRFHLSGSCRLINRRVTGGTQVVRRFTDFRLCGATAVLLRLSHASAGTASVKAPYQRPTESKVKPVKPLNLRATCGLLAGYFQDGRLRGG